MIRDLIRTIHRGYYTAARRYDFLSSSGENKIFYERAQRVSKISFLTREDKSHAYLEASV